MSKRLITVRSGKEEIQMEVTEGMAVEIAFATKNGKEIRFMEPEVMEGGCSDGDGHGGDTADRE